MTESANALLGYIEHTANAFAPGDLQREFLAIGSAGVASLKNARKHEKLDALTDAIAPMLARVGSGEGA
jgi:hypothetical protein